METLEQKIQDLARRCDANQFIPGEKNYMSLAGYINLRFVCILVFEYNYDFIPPNIIIKPLKQEDSF